MGHFQQNQAAIMALIEPILADQDMELVDLSFHREGRALAIRCLIDAVGGVNLQRCATVNRRIGKALEESDLIEDSFVVEVSSPGADRPLVTTRDFERSLGERLQIDIRGENGNISAIAGMLLAIQDDTLVLKTEGGNITIERTKVHKAVKALPW